ncbi:MAG: hypothetical protein ABIH66_14220 [bacterium]
MKKQLCSVFHRDSAEKAYRLVLSAFLIAGFFAVISSPPVEGAEENLEKLLSSQEKGWAAGKWKFSILLQKQRLGDMEMEIRETKKGYETDMSTKFTLKNMEYEITGRSKMDENLGLLWAERVEKGASKDGEIKIAITAEVKDKMLVITVSENGKETERTEIEAPSPLYAGTPALFAMTKLLNLRRPQKLSFSLYNSENRRIVKTDLDILSDRKLIKVGGRKTEAYSVIADNGKNKMLFEVDPGNEIVRLRVPGEELSFERIFQKPE